MPANVAMPSQKRFIENLLVPGRSSASRPPVVNLVDRFLWQRASLERQNRRGLGWVLRFQYIGGGSCAIVFFDAAATRGGCAGTD